MILKIIKIKKYLKNQIQLMYIRRKTRGVLDDSTVIKEGKYIKLGNNYVIGENSKLMCWGKYTSGKKKQLLNPHLIIGNNFRATSELVIQCAGNIKIGNDVLVGRNVFIIDYNHGTNPCTENYLDNELEIKNIEINDGCWIGSNVIILPGTKIGKKCIIGAGSVVKNSIDDYSIIAGNPAKVIKKYDFKLRKWIKVDK